MKPSDYPYAEQYSKSGSCSRSRAAAGSRWESPADDQFHDLGNSWAVILTGDGWELECQHSGLTIGLDATDEETAIQAGKSVAYLVWFTFDNTTMIKRPLNSQFSGKVKAGEKITTIRDKVWPINVPIMLYNWAGAPYRSKHVDVAPIKVMGCWPILITHCDDGSMVYALGMENERELWETEGFESADQMDDWFRPLVRKNETVVKVAMRFRLVNTD